MRTIRNVVFVVLCAMVLVAPEPTGASSESGGFFCGYGMCTLLYDGCDWAHRDDLGGGDCEVTTSQNHGCQVTYWCDSGSGWQWYVSSTSSRCCEPLIN